MWYYCRKMEFQKIVNFLDTTFDDKDLPRFITKNRLKFMINQEETTMLIKKTSLLRSDLCDYSDAYYCCERRYYCC